MNPSSMPPASSVAAVSAPDADGVVTIVPGLLTKKILKAGTGSTPADRSDVKVHYTGRLLDGTVFDSSKTRNEPFVFKIGKGQVIKGWDQGVATMRVGEHAMLTCAPEYAYGARGSPPTIPPNATLEFEVELLSFDNTVKVTEDGGVKKAIKTVGRGAMKPNDGAKVVVKYTGRIAGESDVLFDSKGPITMELDSDASVVWGLEEAVKNMLEGEVCTVSVSADYGYSEKGCVAPRVPPNSALEFDVELVSFTKAPLPGELTFDDRLALMSRMKEYANALFKTGVSLPRAEKVYTKVVNLFPHEGSLTDDQKKAVDAIKIAAIGNHTLCKLKQQDWSAVVSHANAGLAIAPNHVKCLYYRGQAYLKQGLLVEAEADFRVANQADPANKDVARELNALKARNKAIADKEKKAFGGFFGKVQLVTAEEEKIAAKQAADAAAAKAKKDAEDASDDDDEGDDDDAPPAAAQ